MGEQIPMFQSEADQPSTDKPRRTRPKRPTRMYLRDHRMIPEHYRRWPEGRPMYTHATVTIIHRGGSTREVEFVGYTDKDKKDKGYWHFSVRWPIANTHMELAVHDGGDVTGEWWLDAGALAAIQEQAEKLRREARKWMTKEE